jgi:hypothetical protein
VYIVKAPVPTQDIAEVTGPDGRFSLIAPAFGRYRIGVNAAGTGHREQDVDVFAAIPEMEIRLEPKRSP